MRYISLIITFAFVFTSQIAHAQWTAPTQAPPNGNVSAPINVGTSAQVKNGSLSVNAFTAYLDSYFSQKVGIQATPVGALTVGNDLTISSTDSSADPGTPWIRSNGGYLVINPRPSNQLYLAWDAGSAVQVGPDLYAPKFYDRNDGNYLADPNGTSRFSILTSDVFSTPYSGNNSGLTGDRAYQFGYQEGGSWTYPYPDLVIGYHTGLKLGGYYGYGGTKFYNDHPSRTTTEIFSIGNGDNNTRTSYDIYANAFYYTSDKRMKKDIRPLDGSLDKVMKLEGVSFRWKDEEKGKSTKIGLIAQDVEKVYPEAVAADKNTGIKSVEYGNLVAPLIEAVKEQQRQINELRAEIESLKSGR